MAPSTATAVTEPDEAEVRRIDFLSREVPRHVRQCAQIAEAFAVGEASKLDLVLSENSMRQLIGDAVDICSGSGRAFGYRLNEFEVESKEPGQFVSALAPMAYCPESVFIVHGPIMIGRACAIAGEILEPDESITGFADIRLARPVVHDLIFDISRHDPPPGRVDWLPAAIQGQILTSRGERLHFAAYEDMNRPVTRWIDNEELKQACSLERDDDRGLVMRLNPAGISEADSRYPQAAFIQLLLEIMMRTIVVTRGVDGRGLLLARIPSITLPTDLDAVRADGLAVIVTPAPAKQGTRKLVWRKLPVSYREIVPETGFQADILIVEGRVTIGSIFKKVAGSAP